MGNYSQSQVKWLNNEKGGYDEKAIYGSCHLDGRNRMHYTFAKWFWCSFVEDRFY
jgi:hypothetical protein